MSKRRVRILACVLSLAFASACYHDGASPPHKGSKVAARSGPKSETEPLPITLEPRQAEQMSADAPSESAPSAARREDVTVGSDPTAKLGAVLAYEQSADQMKRPAKPKKDAHGSLGVTGTGAGGGGYGVGKVAAAPLARMAAVLAEPNREAYAHIAENDFHKVGDQPLSTFLDMVQASARLGLGS